ncbi:MAG: SRPBCC domain-containing protein [Thermoleophilia bacterium]
MADGITELTLPSATEILITRRLEAAPAAVYRAWTTPELVRRWWHADRGEMTVCEIDLRVGGAWRFAMRTPGGMEVAFHGEYREVVPQRRLVNTEVFEGAGDWTGAEPTVNETEFLEHDRGTLLRLLVRAPSEAVRDTILHSGMEDGLADALRLLDTAAGSAEEGPLVLGVDFVTVPTQDFPRAVAFYGEVLGLPCVQRYGDRPGAEFQAGNLTLAVMDPSAFGGQFRPNAMPIALRVADVAAARARLEAAGVRFLTDTFDSGVCHQAIFADPDGNPLDLHHRYAPRAAQAPSAMT